MRAQDHRRPRVEDLPHDRTPPAWRPGRLAVDDPATRTTSGRTANALRGAGCRGEAERERSLFARIRYGAQPPQPDSLGGHAGAASRSWALPGSSGRDAGLPTSRLSGPARRRPGSGALRRTVVMTYRTRRIGAPRGSRCFGGLGRYHCGLARSRRRRQDGEHHRLSVDEATSASHADDAEVGMSTHRRIA